LTRMTFGRALLAPVVLAIVAVASPALSDETHETREAREADDAMHHGVQLRRERRDEEALAEFRRANTLAPTPRARAQMGLAEQALARWAEADADLRAALASKDDDWIARNRAELESALAIIDGHLEKKAEAPAIGPAPTAAVEPAAAPSATPTATAGNAGM